jgi:osmotically inducible protein OsmC
LIELSTVGDVPGIDERTFIEFAEQAKKGCPVSQALAAVEMSLAVKLASNEYSTIESEVL